MHCDFPLGSSTNPVDTAWWSLANNYPSSAFEDLVKTIQCNLSVTDLVPITASPLLPGLFSSRSAGYFLSTFPSTLSTIWSIDFQPAGIANGRSPPTGILKRLRMVPSPLHCIECYNDYSNVQTRRLYKCGLTSIASRSSSPSALELASKGIL